MKTPHDRIDAIERAVNTLTIKALALKLELSKADWKEEDHPRADDGKFGSGSGSHKEPERKEKESSANSNKKPSGETREERRERYKKEEEEEESRRKEAEERHQKNVDAKHFPPPSQEDIEDNRNSARYIVEEVAGYGKDALQRQYEGILRDIKRGENGDGTSDYSWMPGRMIALKEEYEKELKL